MNMKDWEALFEWLSGGFMHIPTENLLSLLRQLQEEVDKREAKEGSSNV